MKASKTHEQSQEATETSWKTIGLRILIVLGGLVILGVCLQPDSIKSLDLKNADAVKEVFFGGQPHLVLCDSSRKDAGDIVARVSQAAIVLQSGAGGKISTVAANCTEPMASGRSIVDRFKAQFQIKSKRSSKPRLPSPLAFTVANGQAPTVIPPALLKGRLPPGSQVRDTATMAADVAVLVATVKENTGLRKINRLKSSSSLSKCIASARRCAVLLYSLPLPPTSTKNPWTHGLDGSNALKAARAAHRDVQFAVLNTTRHGMKGVPAALKQMLPKQLGTPLPGGLSTALTSAPGAILVLSQAPGGACPTSTAAQKAGSQHASKGRHVATVHAFEGEITQAAVTAAVTQAESDTDALAALGEADRCSPAALPRSSSTRVLKSALRVFGRQSASKGTAIKAEAAPRKRRPPPQATAAPTPQPAAQQSDSGERELSAAEQAAREAAARAAMDEAAREFIPEYLDDDDEEEAVDLGDDEMPEDDSGDDLDVEEIEL